MAFCKRAIYDLNLCQFEGRITDDPILEKRTRSDGVDYDCVTFTLVCNSNPFNMNARTYFHCYATGTKATKILVRIHKGSHVMIISEAHSTATKPDKKRGIPSFLGNQFEVKYLYLVADPPPIDPDNPPKEKRNHQRKDNVLVPTVKDLVQQLSKEELDFNEILSSTFNEEEGEPEQ